MKNQLRIMALVLAVGTSQIAAANTGLEGKYILLNQACASGHQAKPMSSGESEGQSFVTVLLSSTQLYLNMQIDYKFKAGVARRLLGQLRNSIAIEENLPNSPEKKKALTELNKIITDIRRMANGVKCSVKALSSYSVKNTVIHTEPISYSNDCPGPADSSSDKTDDSEFVLSGDILKVMSISPITTENNTCPKGDRTISFFKRVQ
jgi:hypothetical protein